MSKQEEIKQALVAASTEHEWDTDGTFIQWKDGHVLQGTYRQIAITQAKTPEMFNNPNHENDANLIAKAPEYIAYLLEENERLRNDLKKADYGLSSILLGEWVCTYDEQGLEVWTTRRINPPQIANEALALGQEGEGNQDAQG